MTTFKSAFATAQPKWRERQHYLIGCAKSCMDSHMLSACRDHSDSCGYKLEQAMSLLQEAIDMEKFYEKELAEQ